MVYYTDHSGFFLKDSARYLLENGQTLPLNYAAFANDALIIDGLKSRRVKLINQHTGRGLTFKFPGFPVLALWTPPAKEAPFICLEPWLGLPAATSESGDFEAKPYVVTIPPAAEFAVGYTMEII